MTKVRGKGLEIIE